MLSNEQEIAAETREWVKSVVIGEGLCPFAKPVLDSLHIEVSLTENDNLLTEQLMNLMARMVDTPATELPTALFVVARALDHFDQYWNWFDICDRLNSQMGYEGIIQLASFHPRYVFEGESESDMSHFTNRSPFPMVHLIREEDIDQTLNGVAFPERIPERNRPHMRKLGRQGLIEVMPSLARLFHP